MRTRPLGRPGTPFSPRLGVACGRLCEPMRDPRSGHVRLSPETRTHEEGAFGPPERADSGRGALQTDPGHGGQRACGLGGAPGRLPSHRHRPPPPHRSAPHRTAPHPREQGTRPSPEAATSPAPSGLSSARASGHQGETTASRPSAQEAGGGPQAVAHLWGGRPSGAAAGRRGRRTAADHCPSRAGAAAAGKEAAGAAGSEGRWGPASTDWAGAAEVGSGHRRAACTPAGSWSSQQPRGDGAAAHLPPTASCGHTWGSILTFQV